MADQKQGGSGVRVLLLIALAWFLLSRFDVRTAPVKVPGLTACYIEETGDAFTLSPEQYKIYRAKGPGSVRAFLELHAHRTGDAVDARWLDQDSDPSRCLPVIEEMRRRWEEQGRPLPWRHITNGRRFYEGTPTSEADELAKLETLK